MALAANTDILSALNNLIALDYDAIAAYDASLERLVDNDLKAGMQGFRADHERHVRELSDMVRAHGGTPRAKGDVMQVLTQGTVVIRSITGDEGILKAMKMNEDQTNAGYERALKTQGIPMDVRTLLERNLSDERRHRRWIVEAIDRLFGGSKVTP